MAFDPFTYSSLEDLNGTWHIPVNPEIRALTTRTAELVAQLNQLPPADLVTRQELLTQILHPDSGRCMIQQPFRVEYGQHTTIGDGCFLNYNCTILDTAPVHISDGVLIGPNCQIITVTHPVDDPEMRAGGWEYAEPIVIENNVWLGAGVTILPGVRIGENSVIGAASVVTKDIPPNSVAVGSPARVLRTVDSQRAERQQLPVGVPVDAFAEMDWPAPEAER